MTTINQQQQHNYSLPKNGDSMAASIGGMPHGLGLLTTVASLPPKYRSRYLNIKTKCEIPLDLSVKPMSPQIANDVPIATTFTEVYTEEPQPDEAKEEAAAAAAEIVTLRAPTSAVTITRIPKIIKTANPTPPQVTTQTPTTIPIPIITTTIPITTRTTAIPTIHAKRTYTAHHTEEENDVAVAIVERFIADACAANPLKIPKTEVVQQQPSPQITTNINYKNNNNNNNITVVADNDCLVAQTKPKPELTPLKPIIKHKESPLPPPKSSKSQSATATTKSSRHKATRKLKFDEETSSPVSGTIIRPLEDITDGDVQYSNGDIDPKYNIVEITEETKAELAAIKNVIGDYICKLCRLKFEDAFGLARHRCACIVLLEYRCPECGKQFNCPANLASHRRWHKPKKEQNSSSMNISAKKENRNTTNARPTAQGASAAKKSEELIYACGDCGKKFKRQAYLRKHQLTHATNVKATKEPAVERRLMATMTVKNRPTPTYQSYGGGSISGSGSGASSASSMHSYNGAHEEEALHYVAPSSSGGYEYDDMDSMSECSNSSTGYGRLQIVESGLTEEENIAAAALTNLRNCASVIQHTTLAH